MRIFLPVWLLMLSACTSNHFVNLNYGSDPAARSDQSGPRFTLGYVEDDRKEQSNIIGTIRGGYGNPLKRIQLEGSVAEQVRSFVEEALAARGLLASKESSPRPPLLNVRLNRLDSSYLVRKEAHASVSLVVMSAGKEETYLEETYTADLTRGGVGAGIFGNAEALGALANQALTEAVDEALNDPRLLTAGADALAYTAAPTGLTARLAELNKLRDERVISQEEYEQARRAVLTSQ